MPQDSRDVGWVLLPMHFDTPPQVRGPLNKITAIFTFPSPILKAPMKSLAAVISALHPSLPRLPLPSRSKITSSDLLQVNGASVDRVLHLTMLQLWYCNLFTDHWSAHSPAPSASCL